MIYVQFCVIICTSYRAVPHSTPRISDFRVVRVHSPSANSVPPFLVYLICAGSFCLEVSCRNLSERYRSCCEI